MSSIINFGEQAKDSLSEISEYLGLNQEQAIRAGLSFLAALAKHTKDSGEVPDITVTRSDKKIFSVDMEQVIKNVRRS